MTWGNENMERMTTIIMNTSEGSITINLFDDKAPNTVANFLGLATGEKEWADPYTGQPSHGKFYNTTVPTPWLDGHHTIFGEVADDDSKKVVDKLEALDTDPMDRPLEPAVILSVDVAE